MERASTAGSIGGRSVISLDMQPTIQRRPASTASSVSSLHGDYLLETGLHGNDVLQTIQEDE